MKTSSPRFAARRTPGFTLVETIIYVTIFAVFVGALTSFLGLMSAARMRHQAVIEVDDQGEAAMNVITQTIRNGVSVSFPAVGAASSTLTIATVAPETNPTIFYLDAGKLYVKEGTRAAVALTNGRVTYGGLSFWNLSRAGTKGTVRVRFSGAAAARTSGKTDAYVADFYGTASLR